MSSITFTSAMAATDLPCDGDGVCMKCKAPSSESDALLCRTCATPWHVPCLAAPPARMEDAVDWLCPDCSPTDDAAAFAVSGAVGSSSFSSGGGGGELVAAIRAIEKDESLTEREKARRRQALVSGGNVMMEEEEEEEEGEEKKPKEEKDDVMSILDGSFNCAFCMRLPERPVTTPCGHNFCLKCFQKWIGQGKLKCANCRASIPQKFASQPRINATLVVAIRMAKSAKSATARTGHVYHFMRNDSRPEKAFTTERAKRAGKANACSGQIFVTVPPDHFGPIPPENDPKMNRGVLVGDSWDDRFECRQWGAHLPHVAGIAGQSKYGSQSVALSGGYEDDEDHGEWFLYTGSGGRDLSGNKRTNKHQAFDQKFEKLNQALRVSCMEGYPVRVVRSFKEKRSSYAPEKGVRYDGVYRIEKCWRKIGIQGFKVCRYLFVRCDNEPAPWTSDEHGDCPRPLPVIKELKGATDVTERKDTPSWDYDEAKGWTWVKPPPISRSPVRTVDPNEQMIVRKAIKNAQNTSIRERLLKEFSCLLCRKVMISPLTTPCGHNFCKSCLLGAYSDPSFVRERGAASGRSLRAKKIVKKCPSCPVDISYFLQNPQVNRELMDLIESLKRKSEEKEKEVVEGGDSDDDGIDEVEEAENQADSGDAGSEKLMSEVASVEDKKLDVDPNVSKDTELEEGGREGEGANTTAVQNQSATPRKRKKEAVVPKQSPKKAKTVSNGDRDASPSSPLSVPAQDD